MNTINECYVKWGDGECQAEVPPANRGNPFMPSFIGASQCCDSNNLRCLIKLYMNQLVRWKVWEGSIWMYKCMQNSSNIPGFDQQSCPHLLQKLYLALAGHWQISAVDQTMSWDLLMRRNRGPGLSPLQLVTIAAGWSLDTIIPCHSLLGLIYFWVLEFMQALPTDMLAIGVLFLYHHLTCIAECIIE